MKGSLLRILISTAVVGNGRLVIFAVRSVSGLPCGQAVSSGGSTMYREVKRGTICVPSFLDTMMRLGFVAGGLLFRMPGILYSLARLAPVPWEGDPNHDGKRVFYLLSPCVVRGLLMFMVNIPSP